MATNRPSPTPSTDSLPELAPPSGLEATSLANENALVLSSPIERGSILARNPSLALLPVELDVAVPVRAFMVRNLLALEARQVIETAWTRGDEMPLAARDTQLAWTEFEVVESKLAVRITRLA